MSFDDVLGLRPGDWVVWVGTTEPGRQPHGALGEVHLPSTHTEGAYIHFEEGYGGLYDENDIGCIRKVEPPSTEQRELVAKVRRWLRAHADTSAVLFSQTGVLVMTWGDPVATRDELRSHFGPSIDVIPAPDPDATERGE